MIIPLIRGLYNYEHQPSYISLIKNRLVIPYIVFFGFLSPFLQGENQPSYIQVAIWDCFGLYFTQLEEKKNCTRLLGEQELISLCLSLKIQADISDFTYKD
jgi:hypothetical protein